MSFEVGDFVTPTKRIIDLPQGRTYEIVDIHRGLDGAYDWDDLFLKGFGKRKFCEFDFKKEKP